jgi:hypothetical protein
MAAFSTVALVTAFAGLGVQAYGQYRAGKASQREGEAQRRAADSQAALLDYNAAVADVQAKDAVARGAEEEGKYRQGVRKLIATQRATVAANNVDVSFGSAADVQADAAFLGELDALTIRTNAAREAWGFKVEAEDTRKRAEIARREGIMLEAAGRERRTASNVAMAGGLLGGTGSLLAAKYGF